MGILNSEEEFNKGMMMMMMMMMSLNNHVAQPLLKTSPPAAPAACHVCQLRGILASARGHSVLPTAVQRNWMK
jgi:hypothetical protein